MLALNINCEVSSVGVFYRNMGQYYVITYCNLLECNHFLLILISPSTVAIITYVNYNTTFDSNQALKQIYHTVYIVSELE